MKQYNPKELEPRWQKIWDESGVYTADLRSSKPKYIGMSMFNYPSGLGIHIGHALNYTISDVKARFKRQQGFESYHPVGWDSFGLPAENYAIKAGISPQESMASIIPNYHKQYKAMGWSNDWTKEIATHTPEYYKWTQWLFLQMHKHGLAYQDSRQQWWCDKCQTVLANEQVIDGKCWRHDGADDPEVAKREVKQWFFKITDYAEELLEATESLDWTDSVKLAQKNWIGKSIGAEIDFKVDTQAEVLKVFTTRPDTLFGATFMVLAPEHPMVEQLTISDYQDEMAAYIKQAATKTEVERQAASSKDKTGVFTGSYAINPANNERIPIWVADYVLVGYGTGAIMAVPAHDERDYAFAAKYNLDVKPVIEPIFIDTTETGRCRLDKPVVEREAVLAIVKHWSEDKYLGLKWKKVDWETFVTGGIEEGQTPEEAAQAEIKEETGYLNLKLVKQLGRFHSKFFHPPKDVNRYAHFYDFYFELENGEQEPVSSEEQSNHEVVWLTKDEVAKFNLAPGHRYCWEELTNGPLIYSGEGLMVNSGKYNGLESSEAREQIIKDLSKKGSASEKINYKMRDWSVSRQRYWGAPIPIINCAKCGPVLVPEDDLPVVLPELDDFKPSGDGRSALARASDWLATACPECGGPAERETDTLDTYLDSSWYMYRYFDPLNSDRIFDSEVVKKWEPIDFYNGADHATAHLLYARFIGHFFTRLGLVDEPEPFKQFLFNGKVTASDGTMFSKSKGNGVDPLEIIESGYGADALRIYLMFAAPLEQWIRWDPQGVPGAYRFLVRLWNLVQEYIEAKPVKVDAELAAELARATHGMIKKMTKDLEQNAYNTAIAAAMTQVNQLYKLKTTAFGQHEAWQAALESAVACVAPFAPYMADELWHDLGHSTSVHRDSWPAFDEAMLAKEVITIVVQVNGKVRANIEMPVDIGEAEMAKAALGEPKVAEHVATGKLAKTITVPKKLVNFVVV